MEDKRINKIIHACAGIALETSRPQLKDNITPSHVVMRQAFDVPMLRRTLIRERFCLETPALSSFSQDIYDDVIRAASRLYAIETFFKCMHEEQAD